MLVDGGSVESWRDADGTINLANLTTPVGSRAARGGRADADDDRRAGRAGRAAEPPFLFTAPDIELKGLIVNVEDRQISPSIKLMLDPFNLRVTGYSTAPGTTIGIVTDTKIDKTGSLEADLKYGLDDGKLEGKAKLAAFDMTVIQPYLDRYTKMDLLSGHLTADLNVLLLGDGGLATDGVVQVDKLRTVDKAQQEDFLKWDLLRAEGFSYDGRTAAAAHQAPEDARGLCARDHRQGRDPQRRRDLHGRQIPRPPTRRRSSTPRRKARRPRRRRSRSTRSPSRTVR